MARTVPFDGAVLFHEKWGTQARVNGSCVCPSPLEETSGLAVGLYHIDTQPALNAFAAMLKAICEKHQ